MAFEEEFAREIYDIAKQNFDLVKYQEAATGNPDKTGLDNEVASDVTALAKHLKKIDALRDLLNTANASLEALNKYPIKFNPPSMDKARKQITDAVTKINHRIEMEALPAAVLAPRTLMGSVEYLTENIGNNR